MKTLLLIYTSLTVDEAWTAFAETLTATADKHDLLATKRVRVESLPWLTCEIREQMRTRDFHHKRAQKKKTTEGNGLNTKSCEMKLHASLEMLHKITTPT